MIYTTLNKVRAHDPCSDGWTKLLAHLGKTEADDEPLGLDVILESNGLDDCLWALKSVPEHDRLWQHLACDFAEHVAHHFNDACPDDPRINDVIATVRRYADGSATNKELAAAWAAARAAAGEAGVAWAAWGAEAAGAARAAAGAAEGAAWAAFDAAWDAAWTVGVAAGPAARAAEEEWQATRLLEVLNEAKGGGDDE